MGITKTKHYSDNQIDIAAIAKALGHPARVAIVDYLLKTTQACTCEDRCICSDIVNELPLTQPTVSQHLKELKNAGIIKGEVEGNAICYCIDCEVIKKINDYLSDISEKIKTGNQCC